MNNLPDFEPTASLEPPLPYVELRTLPVGARFKFLAPDLLNYSGREFVVITQGTGRTVIAPTSSALPVEMVSFEARDVVTGAAVEVGFVVSRPREEPVAGGAQVVPL